MVAGAKAPGPIHESLCTKNPRLIWAASSAGNAGTLAYYSVDFDSIEATANFSTKYMSVNGMQRP